MSPRASGVWYRVLNHLERSLLRQQQHEQAAVLPSLPEARAVQELHRVLPAGGKHAVRARRRQAQKEVGKLKLGLKKPPWPL